MSRVPLDDIEYVGADIVDPLVLNNERSYGRDRVAFRKLDLTTDSLPFLDLILCRDCLVHLSYDDIMAALRQICRSGSRYLLTTTFPMRERNTDIVSGGWRTLNLEKPPFEFARPRQLLNEQCTEGDGAFSDKCLGLWLVKDIEEDLSYYSGRSAAALAAGRKDLR